MKKFISSKYFYYILGLILFIGLWFFIALVIDENIMIFPDPISVIVEVFRILTRSTYIYKCILSSLLRIIIGFTISFILAFILGTLSGNFINFKRVITPLVVALKAVPTATLVFFFLILVGGRSAPILMVILLSFPILFEGFANGIENIDPYVKAAIKVDGGWNLRGVFVQQLPLALPYILVSISSSFALSFKIEIMAEILTGDTGIGLGSAILASQQNDPTNMIPIFAYSLITITFVLIVSLIGGIIKKKIKYY